MWFNIFNPFAWMNPQTNEPTKTEIEDNEDLPEDLVDTVDDDLEEIAE